MATPVQDQSWAISASTARAARFAAATTASSGYCEWELACTAALMESSAILSSTAFSDDGLGSSF
ncbi:MAG: hypothetical protein JWO10_316, partial [Microbacteriaceae bacterium]|nr:hypothetical protein [Microbacteriaceae bacterium]